MYILQNDGQFWKILEDEREEQLICKRFKAF